MIEHPSRQQWVQITEMAAERIKSVVTESGADLPPLGEQFVEGALAKFKASAARPTQDLAFALILHDLAGSGQVLLEGSRALRAVPFTGDYTLYDPIQRLTCCAYRRAVELGGADAAEFEQYLSFAEHDGAPGPLVIQGPERNRLSAENHNTATQIAWNGKRPNANAIANTLSGVAELGFVWAFGGSDRWPRPTVEKEIAASTELLRTMDVIAPIRTA